MTIEFSSSCLQRTQEPGTTIRIQASLVREDRVIGSTVIRSVRGPAPSSAEHHRGKSLPAARPAVACSR